MPRTSPVPSYRLHKPSGQAVVTVRHADGSRRDHYLGRYNSDESRRAYARLVAELAAGPAPPAPSAAPAALTVNELLLAYKAHAERHYRGPDGRPTSEVCVVRLVSQSLRLLYGETPAAAFGPLALKAARQRWVADGRSRSEVNRRAGIVKRIFRWGVSEELVPAAVYQALATVAGLQRGRTEAAEPEPVGPVEDAVVDATLPHLGRHVAGLVELQRLTGCRPGEACAVRRCDIDSGGPVWLYRPPHHKGSWRGKGRVIAIGPRGQALLRPFLTPAAGDYLFSPARAEADRDAARAAARKTPRYPSHVARSRAKRKRAPRRAPKDRYDHTSYARAVARACDRAFPPPGDLARREGETRAAWAARLTDAQRAELAAWRAAHHWHPNQLRHSFATRVRKEHGLEAAQVLLGHERADVTQIYAEKNEALAVAIAGRVG